MQPFIFVLDCTHDLRSRTDQRENVCVRRGTRDASTRARKCSDSGGGGGRQLMHSVFIPACFRFPTSICSSFAAAERLCRPRTIRTTAPWRRWLMNYSARADVTGWNTRAQFRFVGTYAFASVYIRREGCCRSASANFKEAYIHNTHITKRYACIWISLENLETARYASTRYFISFLSKI